MDTKEATAVKARMKAEEDWRNLHSGYLFNGDVYSKTPLISESGFYGRCCFEGATYVSAYNKRTRELVAESGIPEWAPGLRILPPKEVREAILNGKPLEEIKLQSAEKLQLVEDWILVWRYRFGLSPEVFYHDQTREVMVIAAKTGEWWTYDQMDTLAMSWLSTGKLSV